MDKNIQLKLDLNNDGIIDKNEKEIFIKNTKKLLDELNILEEELREQKIQTKYIKPILIDYLQKLKKLNYHFEKENQNVIDTVQAELEDLINNISIKQLLIKKNIIKLKELAKEKGMLFIINSFDLENIDKELFKSIGKNNLIEIFSISVRNSKEYPVLLSDYNYFFRKVGLNKNDILGIYKNLNSNYPIESIITDLELLKEEGYTDQKLKNMISTIYTNEELVNKLKNMNDLLIDSFLRDLYIYRNIYNISNEQLKEIINTFTNKKKYIGFFEMESIFKTFDKDTGISFINKIIEKKGFETFKYYSLILKEYLTPDETTNLILKKVKGNGFLFLTILDRYKYLGDRNIAKIIKKGFNLKYNISNNFLKNYKILNLLENKRENIQIYLGNNYQNYRRLFENENDYKKFIEKIIIKGNIKVSKNLNKLYDHYEIEGLTHKQIEEEIKKNLGKFSTIELLSSLGNHRLNYSTTFNLILDEIIKRTNKRGFNNIFDFINKNGNINSKTKKFLKGQVIVGLSARGKIDILVPMIKEDSESYNIIKDIINYKNTDFTFFSYLGLVSGLKDILLKDKKLTNKIFNEYITTNNNPKFKKALTIALLIDGKKITDKGIINIEQKDIDNFKNISKKFFIPKEILLKKEKELIYIYGGESSGGGLERLSNELNIYKNKFGYKEIEKGEGYYVLEKKGVKVIFINYEKITQKILEKFSPVLIAFRGHNFYTSKMIENLKEYITKNPNSIIIDGGCRNASIVDTYRLNGIQNQIVAYRNTGKGWSTFNFTASFIANYIRKKEYIGKNITLKKWAEKELKDNYAKSFMEFPGSLSDIIIKIEKDQL